MLIANTSSKICLGDGKEKSDVRFLPELILADKFVTSQANIHGAVFNSENPNAFSTITSNIESGRGDTVKDLTLQISTSVNIRMDIKIGNNAYKDLFNGTLGPAPILPNGNMENVYALIMLRRLVLYNFKGKYGFLTLLRRKPYK